MKMKFIFLILVSISLIFCVSKTKQKEQKTRIILSDLVFVEKGFSNDTIFNLNKYKTIREFQKARFKANRFGKYSAVNLEIGNTNYILNLESVPNYCMAIYPLKMKNVLFIYEDSIVKSIIPDKSINYPIDSVYSLYKRDIFNNKKETFLSDSPNHLVLSLQLDDSTSIKTTKRLLNKVVNAYLKINKDSLPLNLSLSYRPPMPPPEN